MPPSTNDVLPVTLLTGFLGSGKTTVLNHLLRQWPLTAVVMNEFGEIGLDHQLIESSQGPLALLSGGCVCCQVQGSLAPTLKNLWMARASGTLPAYERLIIETTGIADPGPIAATLSADRWIAARHRLDGIVTTVDAQHALQQIDTHFEAQRQIAVADRLLITKTDLADPDALPALTARLTQLNPAAPQITVVQGALAADQLAGSSLAEAAQSPAKVNTWLASPRYRPVSGGTADHTQRIQSFSLTFETALDWHGLASALEMLQSFRGENLLRMKALVNLQGESGPTVLHAVQHVFYPPTRLDAWPDADHRSRFVFIVSDLDPNFVAKLLEDFTQAALSTDAVSGSTRKVFSPGSTMA